MKTQYILFALVIFLSTSNAILLFKLDKKESELSATGSVATKKSKLGTIESRSKARPSGNSSYDNEYFGELSSLEGESDRMGYFNFVLNDPEEGLALLSRSKDNLTSQEYTEYCGLYAQALAVDDPARALQWASNLEVLKRRSYASESVFSVLIQDEEVSAMDGLHYLTDYLSGGFASTYISSFISKADESSVLDVVSWISQNLSETPNVYYPMLSNLLDRAGRINNNTFLKVAEVLSEESNYEQMLSYSISSIAASDPATALGIIQQLDSSIQSETIINSFVKGSLEAEGIDEIADLLGELGVEDKENYLASNLDSWIQSDPEYAYDWIEKQNPVFKKQLLATPGVVMSLLPHEPVEVMDNLASFQNEKGENNYLMQVAIAEWGYANPEKSGKWLALQKVDLQKELVGNYLKGVYNEDSALAVEHLHRHISDGVILARGLEVLDRLKKK